jgi:pyruvate dehydrogenase E2 component (dihydrolipoamide acetyltransferase)
VTLVEMPKANENLTEATLDHWLVKAGDAVKKDQGLCEIITDKAKFDMPSPCDGVVLECVAPERALLPVGYILCAIGSAGETKDSVPKDIPARNEKLLSEHKAAATSLSGAGAGTDAIAATAGTPVAAPAGAAVRATPVARRLAKEAGVELATIAQALKLSAPVNEKDVKAYLESRRK